MQAVLEKVLLLPQWFGGLWDVWRARLPHRSTSLYVPVALAVCLLSVLIALSRGAFEIAPSQVLAILCKPLGLSLGIDYSPTQEKVLMSIRLPRVLMAALVGATLALSGAALQGLFRNPLAEPGLIGVSSGAAMAASVAIVIRSALPWGLGALAEWFVPVCASVGGLVTMLLVFRLACGRGRTNVATLLLFGVAINAIAGAATGLLIFLSNDQQLRDINFWLMGSLAGTTWKVMSVAAPVLLLCSLLMPTLARSLNLLLLGEREAEDLGVNTERLKRILVTLVGVGVGTAVSFTGMIGFIGLVVPHLVRLATGADHRLLMPVTALGGACLLLIADTTARTVAQPLDVPIGLVTSLFGAPFFLWMLLRRGQGRR